jgi:hypothetical protein
MTPIAPAIAPKAARKKKIVLTGCPPAAVATAPTRS